MTDLSDAELLALLRLQKVPQIGAINAKKLISKCGSAFQIFKERKTVLQKIDGIGDVAIKGLFGSEHHALAAKELVYIKKHHISCCSYEDNHYPDRLKHCIDAPILLFYRGNINLQNQKIISIVGTRNITTYGKSFIEEFVSQIAPLNPVIVSGFAYGVDIFAQQAAITHNLQTIGCLAHGLNQIYPKPHAKYTAAVEENGGFFTEFWSSSNPERENFLRRNRIIAGMSEATIVVESAERGGSLVTADLAHGYHREVFAVPGRYGDKYSTGCNNLIKQQKAHILTSAADVLYVLGWDVESEKSKTVQKQLFVELNETEKTIYHYLHSNGKQLLDTVALACEIPIFTLASTLLTMEMKGVVRPLPGKVFEAI